MSLLVRNNCLLHFELQSSHLIKKRKCSKDNNEIYTIKVITRFSKRRKLLINYLVKQFLGKPEAQGLRSLIDVTIMF